MSFNRLRAQMLCEDLSGCVNVLNWHNHRATFEGLSLTEESTEKLQVALADDAKGLYLKGLQSLAEAISSSRRMLFSWATVKAYY